MRSLGRTRIPCVRMVMHHHNDDCFCILDGEEMHRQKGSYKKWKARKEKAKLEKIERMKSELRKQGLLVDDVKSVEIETIDRNPIEPRIKY